MTFISEDHNILKSDEKGRVRVPAERREALLDEFERSGLSGVKFAALVGVKYPTFALWVQKRRKLRSQAAVEASAGESAAGPMASPHPLRLLESFGEVGGRSAETAGLTMELPGGARVRVESPSQLQLAVELLRLLVVSGGRPC